MPDQPIRMSTKVVSVSIPVADQDAAIRFYTGVLGFELVADVEAWPGARWVEVALPGSEVTVALLPPDSDIPVALRLEGMPPMFHFSDHDGNGLVYLERADARSGEVNG